MEKGCLYDRHLLISVRELISTDRLGYSREGTNSDSVPIDFDLTVDTEEYKMIKDFKICFLSNNILDKSLTCS